MTNTIKEIWLRRKEVKYQLQFSSLIYAPLFVFLLNTANDKPITSGFIWGNVGFFLFLLLSTGLGYLGLSSLKKKLNKPFHKLLPAVFIFVILALLLFYVLIMVATPILVYIFSAGDIKVSYLANALLPYQFLAT